MYSGTLYKTFPILCGQILSPLLALSGLFAQILAQNVGVSLPFLQTGAVYFCLFILFQVPRIFRYFPNTASIRSASEINSDFEDAGCLKLISKTYSRAYTAGENSGFGDGTYLNINSEEDEDEEESEREYEEELAADPGQAERRSNETNSPVNILSFRFALLAFFDVEANALVTFAYRYTTLTSVMILDCFTIPFVMCLSVVFFGSVYCRLHFIGVLVCLLGLGIVVTSDAITGRAGSETTFDVPTRLLGDGACILGAVFYAISNVCQEKVVKEIDKETFLAMIGTWGAILSLIQSLLFEDWSQINWKNSSFVYSFILYVVVLVAYYIMMSNFLVYHDATFLNISILTSDVWGIAFGYFIFHEHLHWLYFIGFFTVIAGAILYNREPPKKRT
mmetsp:Transcript_6096/g.6982  ORF Transcript_6096/g.6982 Transcript_6096/m.6982 type:complete len:392 (+) Transcript_6096:132-1307(+)